MTVAHIVVTILGALMVGFSAYSVFAGAEYGPSDWRPERRRTPVTAQGRTRWGSAPAALGSGSAGGAGWGRGVWGWGCARLGGWLWWGGRGGGGGSSVRSGAG